MKKITCLVLAFIVVAGLIIMKFVGFNFDIMYAKHTQINVSLEKEYNEVEIKSLVQEVLPNQRFIINGTKVFGDSFEIKTKDISKEQLENLKKKLAEKYEIEDISEMVTVTKVGNERLRDILDPYIIPVIISAIVILAYMGLRYRKIGTFKVIIIELVALIMAELLFACAMAILRCPINRLFIPAGSAIYILVTVVTCIAFKQQLSQIEKDEKVKNA